MTLQRVLGARDAAWIVAGSMVGSGIFITPGFVAGRLPGLFWPLAGWLLGGVISLAGAAVYGELGSRLPVAGGDYQYLRTAYGPLWGFLNGWAALTLTFSAAAAAQTRSAVEYLGAAFPGGEVPYVGALAAPVLVLLLTWANTIGARTAGRTTVLFTAGPLLILLVLFLVGLATDSSTLHWPERPWTLPSEPLWIALGAAIVPIFFTYSGWNAAAYLAGEMRDPSRSLARGLLLGTAAVTLLYLVVNLALLVVLPHDVLAHSERPAAEALRRLLGETGKRWLAVTIAVAILGSANVTLMAGARVYYAMAGDGLAPRAFARTNRSGVPAVALWAGGVWSAVLSVLGGIKELVGWATLAILLLSSLTVSALFVLRARDPHAHGFRCPGYPWTPLAYLVTCLGAAVSSYLFNPSHALKGLAIILLGLPVFWLARRSFAAPD